MISELKRYRKSFKNWPSVMYHMNRGSNQIKCRLKNGKVFNLEKEFAAYLSHFLEAGVISEREIEEVVNNGLFQFHFSSNIITMKLYDKDKRAGLGDPIPIFFNEDYDFLTKGTETIVDIGANIGDSSIYFALKGIKEVIALEPYPYSFKIAVDNIKFNDLDHRITLINAAFGIDEIVEIEDMVTTPGSDLVLARNGGVKINSLSLSTIVKQFNLVKKNGVALKMDCEGCEYNLLKEDKNTIALFDKIQIEYHYGVKGLDYLLSECGFKTRTTKPVKSYNPSATNPHMEVGYIYGEK